MVNISVHTLQRLSFIRFLYLQGVEQARQPEPMSTSAILTFHDSVELFLVLATEQPGVIFQNKRPDFIDYWTMQLPGGALTQAPIMKKLNRVRVDLKHHGIFPNPATIDELRAATTLFFEENTPTVFGSEFDEVSLASLVASPEARKHLEAAEIMMQAADFEQALIDEARAFARIIGEQLGRERQNDYQSILAQRPLNGAWALSISSTREGKYLGAVEKRINELSETLQVIGWGLDYQRYGHFQRIAPQLWGEYTLPRLQRPATKQDCQFCLMFVITSAIRLQELAALES